ncbi:MAG: glycosyltransferase, partial [Muribaculum sp.]|nr:glycosyltransferase [Muribaculum sp.]
MNILQIYPGKVWGGAEQYILNLIKSLEQRGHDIYTLCRGNGIVQERSNATPFDFKWKWSKEAARRLALYIDENSIDVINIHDRSFIPVAVMARDMASHKCRVVFT